MPFRSLVLVLFVFGLAAEEHAGRLERQVDLLTILTRAAVTGLVRRHPDTVFTEPELPAGTSLAALQSLYLDLRAADCGLRLGPAAATTARAGGAWPFAEAESGDPDRDWGIGEYLARVETIARRALGREPGPTPGCARHLRRQRKVFTNDPLPVDPVLDLPALPYPGPATETWLRPNRWQVLGPALEMGQAAWSGQAMPDLVPLPPYAHQAADGTLLHWHPEDLPCDVDLGPGQRQYALTTVLAPEEGWYEVGLAGQGELALWIDDDLAWQGTVADNAAIICSILLHAGRNRLLLGSRGDGTHAALHLRADRPPPPGRSMADVGAARERILALPDYDRRVRRIAPAAGRSPVGILSWPCRNRCAPGRWLFSGVLSNATADAAVVDTAMGSVRPLPGGPGGLAGLDFTWQVVPDRFLLHDAGEVIESLYSRGFWRETTGLRWIDALGRQAQTTTLFATWLENDRSRLYQVKLKGAGVRGFLGGEAISEDEVIRLPPGRFPLVIITRLGTPPPAILKDIIVAFNLLQLAAVDDPYAGLLEKVEVLLPDLWNIAMTGPASPAGRRAVELLDVWRESRHTEGR